MGHWLQTLEDKAAIICGQMTAARLAAGEDGADELAAVKPYLRLLGDLYKNEYPLAQAMDSSGLIACFQGPAVSASQLPAELVGKVVKGIRDQVRQLAQAIASADGKQSSQGALALEPQLSGIVPGSLVVGLRLPQAPEARAARTPEGLACDALRAAMLGLARVGKHLESDRLGEGLEKEFPDPTVRRALLIAASRIVPTGRNGLESVVFYERGQEPNEAPVLTPASRRVFQQALAKLTKQSSAAMYA